MSKFLKEDGTPWPMCAKPGCKNGVCLRLKSQFCFPHSQTPQDKVMKLMIYSPDRKVVRITSRA